MVLAGPEEVVLPGLIELYVENYIVFCMLKNSLKDIVYNLPIGYFLHRKENKTMSEC